MIKILCGFLLVFASIHEVNADIPQGELRLWFPFNSNANDESGNGHDGIVEGPVLTSDRFGEPDSAYHFDGDDDFITVTTSPGLRPGRPVTLSAITSGPIPSPDRRVILYVLDMILFLLSLKSK